jgi:hypothetical protein
MSPAGWEVTFDNIVSHGQLAGATAGEYLGAIGTGALVRLAVAGPIGAAAVAAAELLFLLFALFCALTGLCSAQGAQSEGGGPPQDDGGNLYTQSKNVLCPPGVAAQPISGPTRSFALQVIPHFPNLNLYGIAAGGNSTFTITNDASLQEILGWLAFPGGSASSLTTPPRGRWTCPEPRFAITSTCLQRSLSRSRMPSPRSHTLPDVTRLQTIREPEVHAASTKAHLEGLISPPANALGSLHQ